MYCSHTLSFPINFINQHNLSQAYTFHSGLFTRFINFSYSLLRIKTTPLLPPKAVLKHRSTTEVLTVQSRFRGGARTSSFHFGYHWLCHIWQHSTTTTTGTQLPLSPGFASFCKSLNKANTSCSSYSHSL